MLANLYNAAFDKGGTALVWPYLFGTGFNLVAGAIAAACVFISPAAQGSGIPQVWSLSQPSLFAFVICGVLEW